MLIARENTCQMTPFSSRVISSVRRDRKQGMDEKSFSFDHFHIFLLFCVSGARVFHVFFIFAWNILFCAASCTSATPFLLVQTKLLLTNRFYVTCPDAWPNSTRVPNFLRTMSSHIDTAAVPVEHRIPQLICLTSIFASHMTHTFVCLHSASLCTHV